jgi:predicted MFS family arabinose efflux permease
LLWKQTLAFSTEMSIFNSIRESRRILPAFAAQGVFWGAFAAYVPHLKATIGASDADYGLVLLFPAVGALTAMWLAPRVEQILGRYTLLVSMVLFALAMQLPVQVSGLWAFAGLMVFVGAGAGVLDVVSNTWLSGVEARSGRSLMNLNHGMFSLAYGVSAVAAGVTRDAGAGPQWLFFLLLILVLLSSAVTTADAPVHSAAGPETSHKTRFPRAVLWGGLIILAGFLAENATEAWAALHIERTLGGGAAEGALGPAMLGFTMAFGRFSGQLLTARFAEAQVVLCAAVMTVTGALIAAAAISPAMAYAGFAMLGLGVSVVAPMVFALIGRRVEGAGRSQAISRAAMIGYLGFFVGPPVMGFVAQTGGLRLSFVFVAMVMALVPGLLILLRRSEVAA